MIAYSMKAAVVSAPRTVSIQSVPIPDAKPGEVRIRLQGCGVCASNLATWQGMPWTQYPTEPGALGHEGWGVVDAVGDGVRSVGVGDRVAVVSYNAYAEYDTAAEDAVVKLPSSMDGAPLPGEPLGCAVNIFKRSAIQPNDTVAIVGIGFLGAVATRLAAQAGARVIAISRRPFALEVAKQMGAAEVVPMDDHSRIIHRVRDLTDGRFCECVIEAVGKQWPLDLSAELVKERGRLVIAGYHQDGPRQVNMQLWNWRGIDVINAHERDVRAYITAMREAVEAVERGILNPSPLLTHSFPLSELATALDLTQNRPDGFLKALMIYD
jgi:threonine dehydrogenase-like Zn-dependent dehydrogenase